MKKLFKSNNIQPFDFISEYETEKEIKRDHHQVNTISYRIRGSLWQKEDSKTKSRIIANKIGLRLLKNKFTI